MGIVATDGKAPSEKVPDSASLSPDANETELPSDWEVAELGDLVDYTKGYAFKSKDYSTHGIRVVRVSDTVFDEILPNNPVFIPESEAAQFTKWKLRTNDLIISTVGSKPPMYDSMVGRAVLVRKRDEGSLLNQNAVLIRDKKHRAHFQLILLNHLRTNKYLTHIESIFRGNANQASITLQELFRFPIEIPTVDSEQRAIAAALSDVDELIGALDKLIAKKRAIKLATMQQLLTGKTRLPGFSGEWVSKVLGDFASIRNVKVMPRQVAPDTPCVELEHIGQRDGRLLGCSTARSSTSSKYRFERGDVLFGRLRSYLRKYWHADRDGICTTEIWPLMIDTSQASSGFLRGIVETESFIDAASVSYGTHMPRADWGVVRNFEVSLPPLNNAAIRPRRSSKA